MLRLASTLATILVVSLLAACGDDDAGGDDAPAVLGPAEVRANLEDGGYEVGEDVTDGANLALPPKGEIDAEVYFSVESGPEQEPGLTAGVYFFSNAADAEEVSAAFADSLNEVRDTRLYNLAGDDADALSALIATGEGE